MGNNYNYFQDNGDQNANSNELSIIMLSYFCSHNVYLFIGKNKIQF